MYTGLVGTVDAAVLFASRKCETIVVTSGNFRKFIDEIILR